MNSSLLRTLTIYAIILPLAVMLGWITVDLAEQDRASFAVFAGVIFVLLLPVLLKWHYMVLIFSWSSFITLFFLPGQPALWMFMALIAVGVGLLNRIVLKRPAFLSTPGVSLSLLLLAAVILFTAWMRGGIGLSILGSSQMGGKPYIFLLGAIAGYFAFTSQAIPVEKARLCVGLFFLSGMMGIASNLIFYAGPAFYFLFLIFPSGFAGVQALSEMGGTGGISRVAGFSTGATAFIYYLMAVYGIRGLFARWWRLGLFLAALGLGLMGGYRSLVVLVAMYFGLLFLMEGLLRSRLFPLMILLGALMFALLIPLAPHLPLSMQRSLTILPLEVDARVRVDANSSLEWRLKIWRTLVPDLPKYFWLGKGYRINPTDLYLADQAQRRGRGSHTSGAVQAGSYHSGPLTLYVPFGAPGVVAFLLFLGVSLRSLYLNYRHGDEALRTINRFMFIYFVGRVIFFFTTFGDFGGELFHFTGAVGLSMALNKGVRRPSVLAPRPVIFRDPLRGASPQPGVA